MTRWWLLLLLALSLLFNFFFAVGFFRAQLATPDAVPTEVRTSDDSAVKAVANELGLDTAQVEILSQLRDGLRAEQSRYEGRVALIRDEIAEEMRNDSPDFDKLRELMGRETELRREFAGLRSRRFNEFLGVLSPDQCKKFSRHMRRGGDRRRGWHQELLKKFDENGDGKLDEGERAKADEYMRSRREQHRRKFFEQFDTDGDGELNEAEQEAFREWRRERESSRQRPPRRQPPPSGL